MTSIDRLGNPLRDDPFRGNVRVVATSNITLSGLQTIDGVLLESGDRVLVQGQTTASENGIYVAKSGQWSRSRDLSTSDDFKGPIYVAVEEGSTLRNAFYSFSPSGPIEVGTDEITFIEGLPIASAVGWTTITEGTGAELVTAASSGKMVIIPSSITAITLTAAEAAIVLPLLYRIQAASETTITVPSVTSSGAAIVRTGPANGNIILSGEAPIETTLTSVVSVSGTSGAYDVILQLPTVSGMEVGQVATLFNVGPLPNLSGDNIYSIRSRPIANELGCPTERAGPLTVTSGAATFSVDLPSGETLSDHMQVGDILHVKGMSRVIATLSTSSGTVSGGNWNESVSATRAYWLTRANTGTVGTGGASSATITGSSTVFLTEANIGDLFLANGIATAISGVANDTSLTLEEAVTLSNGSSYSIITPATLHEGAHRITAVDPGNTRITVRNESRTKPPVNKVSGGVVKVLKTVLTNSSTGDGVLCDHGAVLRIEKIALVGNNSSTGTQGLAGGGRDDDGLTQVSFASDIVLEDCALVNWGYGAVAGTAGNLTAYRTHFGGNQTFNVYALEGSTVAARYMVNSGAGNNGIQANSGSTVLYTEARFNGNAGDGARGQEGAVFYGEIPFAVGNTGMGIRSQGAFFHGNEGVSMLNGASGFRAESGRIDAQRTFIAANRRNANEAFPGGILDLTEAWITGTSNSAGNGDAVFSEGGEAFLDGAGITGNQGAIRATKGARVIGSDCVVASNSIAFYADGPSSLVDLRSSYFSGNATGDATNQGRVEIQGYSGTPATTLTPATLNQEGTDGFAMIAAGADVGRVPKYVGINLTGDGAVTIKPTAPGTGTIDNVVIGGTTPLAGTFTTLTGSTQVVGHANNTAATPAYTFSGNTNSGFYRIASNRIGLSLNGSLVVDFQTGGVFVTGIASYTATNALAFAVGRLGSTTPALVVDTSTASCITGVKVTARATTGGTDLAAVGETNVDLRINAAGTGTLTLNGTATGAVSTPRAFTAASGTAPAAGGSAGLGLLMSSTANLGIFFGTGAPTISAAQNSLYIRTDGTTATTRLYVNTDGGTTWAHFTASA